MTGSQRTDALIAELGAKQHGIVARWQMERAGIPSHFVEYRVRARRFDPVHRGVYRVGPVAGPLAKEMAAVLACSGPVATRRRNDAGNGRKPAAASRPVTAVLSHRSAARLRELLPSQTGAKTEVLVRGRGANRIPGILARPGHFDDDEVTVYDGVPVTTISRTLVDLAGVSSLGELERAVARADRADLLDRDALLASIARRPARPGIAALRALVFGDGDPPLTRSEAEAAFLALARSARLPLPRTNVRVAGYEVDCFWRTERLVVEIDGFAYHSSRRVFENDRRRDAVLTGAGYRVIRITWQQITSEPTATAVLVARALFR